MTASSSATSSSSQTSKASKPAFAAIILAAGQGKRMRSTLPKVLHEVGGEALIMHILRGLADAQEGIPVAVVVGHGREQVEAAIRAHDVFSRLKITFIHQAEQKGTGHAARVAMDASWGKEVLKAKLPVLVLPGDLPLLPSSLIQQMAAPLKVRGGSSAAIRLLTCILPDPFGYGRVVRRGKEGAVLRIVEERDATAREKEIREVACSIYLFQAQFLRFGLDHISNKNSQGEYYLTDLVASAVRARKGIEVLIWADAEDLRGVNDPWELAIARKIMNERCVREWALKGVKFIDPWRNWIDVSVKLAEDVSIHPGAMLHGKTKVERGAIIGPNVVLKDVEVGEGAHLKTGTVAEQSAIGAGAQLGPYAHLRPESRVGKSAKIGNFVELKKASIGEKTSVAHLSYVGDAEVGRHVNIGCGFVTCNFDGRVIEGSRKHKTIIEDEVFLGSDCQVVAPIRIGKGSYIASGSTITENVEAESLAIARSRQVNKPGYARKLRGENKSG